MGMDVYGKKHTAPEGEYFRASVWGWHPLASYVESVCSDLLTGRNQMGHTNDGQGMSATVAKQVAARLTELIESGAAQRYVDERQRELDALPDIECGICAGDGIRPTTPSGEILIRPERKHAMAAIREGAPESLRYTDVQWVRLKDDSNTSVPLDDLIEKPCNGCGGEGKRRPHEASYDLDVETISAFAAFAAASGGFRVY